MSGSSLAQVRAFLAEHHTLTLATLGPDGQPQAADLYYAETDGLAFYFVSVPGSRHAVNIDRNLQVAATIHADSNRWRDIRGVQLEGTCVHVAGAERAMGWTCYAAKFPFVLADKALAGALERVDMYRITPNWLRWIDNSVGLGHNREWVRVDSKWRIVEGGLSPYNDL